MRFADDVVVMCRNREEAERCCGAHGDTWPELGLTLKHVKTRIVRVTEGGEGLVFPGFHHRWCAATRPVRGILFPRPLALASGHAARPQ